VSDFAEDAARLSALLPDGEVCIWGCGAVIALGAEMARHVHDCDHADRFAMSPDELDVSRAAAKDNEDWMVCQACGEEREPPMVALLMAPAREGGSAWALCSECWRAE
jgi:hypothetical protein